MKISNQFFKGIILLLMTLIYVSASGQEVIRLKFNPTVEKTLKAYDNAQVKVSADGYVKTGLTSVDKVIAKYSGAELKRVFRPAGKFEARHEQFGLHLWYELKIGKTDLASYKACLKEFQALSEISISEAKLDKKLYSVSDKNPRVSWVPNDPMYDQQWHYWNTGQTGGTVGADIKLQDAWEIQRGSSNVTIAIIDEGVDYTHTDLAGAMWVNELEQNGSTGVDDDNNGYIDDIHGYGFGDDEGNYIPGEHGTHVGGTVGAVSNNGIGVSGVAGGSGTADGVRLMSCAVFGSFGVGGFDEAFIYAADNGASIAQNSWGYTSPGDYEQSVLDAIDYFIATAGKDLVGEQNGPLFGGIVIFAAGNSDSNEEWYPGFYEPVLSVASTTHNDTKAWYSNYGPWVDVAAPGGETDIEEQGVLSTLPGNSYGFYQGTSMACPHVSGLAGLLVSEYGGPGFTNLNLREIIESTTDDIDDLNPAFIGMLGSGRINAFTALASDDSIPPSRINNLSVVSSAEISVALSWTSTGNDSTTGHASAYDLRYSLAAIDSANFAAASRFFGTPNPQDNGNTENCTVTGLTPGTTYYFALKASDVYGNTSGISNTVSATTLDAPVASVNPAFLSSVLDSGQTETQSFYLKNVGQAQLNYSLESEGSIVVSALGQKNNTSKISFASVPGKGEKDPRIGHPVLTGAGDDGPDGFGYSWIDSDEPGGPAFNWQDISSTGTALYLDDDSYYTLALPFTFNFYGVDYNTIYISSNGFVTFNSDGANSLSNEQIPEAYVPNAFIAADWTDLYPPDGGAIYYLGNANQLIVQYQDIYNYDGSGDNTFQLILKKDGSIKIQYLQMNGYSEASTVGIENPDGTEGLQIAFNTAYIHNNLAIEISKAQPFDFITSILPASGNLAVGDSVQIQVEISSDSLVPGNYEDRVIITSNDPLHPEIGIPVSLHVNGSASITLNTANLTFGQVFLTDTTELSFRITNSGSDSLRITDITSSNSAFIVGAYTDSAVYKGGTIDVSVRFAPALAELYQDTITITSNAANNPVEIILTGTGAHPPVITVTPDSLAADLLTDETETQVINIDNTTGGSDLIVSFSVVGRQIIATQQVPLLSSLNKNTASTFNAAHKPLRDYKLVPVQKGLKPSAVATKVLILHDDACDVSEIYGILQAYTDLNVNTLDGDLNEIILDTLIQYGSVIVTNNGEWNDAVHLGNVLADYVDAGGSVIVTVPTFYPGFGISGRFYDEGYFPVNEAENIADDELGWFNAAHPVMSGINSLEAYTTLNDATLTAGAEDIAEFTSGGILVGTKGNVAALSIFIGDPGYWSGDVPTLFHNTINYFNVTTWLVPEVDSDTITAGSDEDVEITFDATGLFGGDYDAYLVINTNVPTTPIVEIPAHLHVTGIPLIDISTDTINFGQVFAEFTDTITLSIENTGTDLLIVDTIYSNENHFVVDIDSIAIEATEAAEIRIAYTANELQADTGILFIHSNANNNPVLEVLMVGESILPPIISVTPDSLSSVLLLDQSETQTITIDNSDGGSNLYVTLSVVGRSIETSQVPFAVNSNTKSGGLSSMTKPIRNYKLVPSISNIEKSAVPGTVLILHDDISDVSEIQGLLNAYPDINVSTLDADSDELTPEILLDFATVIVSNNGPWTDAVAVGDVLADYVDAGGKVIITSPVFYNSDWALAGRFVTDGYMPLNMAEILDIDILGWFDAGHEIMTGVSTIEADLILSDATISSGSVNVAEFSGGGVLVGTKGNVVSLNIFVADAGWWFGDVPALFYNSINYLNNIEWLIPEFDSVVVPAGESLEVDITFDATDLNIGNYDAYLVINSNDPVNPAINIPAHLQVVEFYNNAPVFNSEDHLYLKINDNTLLVDLDTMFTDADSDELSYDHSLSNSTVATVLIDENQMAIIPLTVGEVTCEIVANDGRGGSVSQDIVITVEEGSSVPDITITAVEVYPNPFTDKVNLKFELEQAGKVQVLIYSTEGKLIGSYVNDYIGSGKHNVEFDASALSETLFIYRILVNNRIVHSGNLIKQ